METIFDFPIPTFFVPMSDFDPASYDGGDFHAAGQAIRVGELALDGVQISLKGKRSGLKGQLERALVRIYGTCDRGQLKVFKCMLGDHIFDLVVPRRGQVVLDRDLKEKETLQQARDRQIAIPKFVSILERFSEIAGLTVRYAFTRGVPHVPIRNNDAITIVTNTYPPGTNAGSRNLEMACGLLLRPRGEVVVAHGATHGRGTIMQDEHGQDVVQIVGNTWYFLLPVVTYFNHETTERIFERLLSLAYTGWRMQPEAPAALTEESYKSSITHWADNLAEFWALQADFHSQEIERLQKEIAENMRSRSAYMSLARMSRDPEHFEQKYLLRAGEDFARTTSHPLVARLTRVGKGFNVDTRPVVIEHEGRRYSVGSYTIRVSDSGHVVVWCDNPIHPGGVMHPHISQQNTVCFGNAGSAIIAAAAEMRIADTFVYVLSWLQDGYTPELAEHRIEEWPVIQEEL